MKELLSNKKLHFCVFVVDRTLCILNISKTINAEVSVCSTTTNGVSSGGGLNAHQSVGL